MSSELRPAEEAILVGIGAFEALRGEAEAGQNALTDSRLYVRAISALCHLTGSL